MSNSFIEYQGVTFREPDSLIEVTWFLLCGEMKRLANPAPGSSQLEQRAHSLWKEYFPQGPGMYGLDLGRMIPDAPSKAFFLRAIDGALASLEGFGSTMPASYLNEHLQSAAAVFKDMNTSRPRRLLQAIKQSVASD